MEAHWSDLTWPAVSLHEWDNQQRERGRSARFERNTGAALRATAKKRSLIERAKRLTYITKPMKSTYRYRGDPWTGPDR